VVVASKPEKETENAFVGGRNRWRYDTFINWEMWWPGFPVLVYFKVGAARRLGGRGGGAWRLVGDKEGLGSGRRGGQGAKEKMHRRISGFQRVGVSEAICQQEAMALESEQGCVPRSCGPGTCIDSEDPGCES
jgi:hypothetical protein